MKIYIDDCYRIHTVATEGYREFDDKGRFDGFCSSYIEGFRYVPFGETWTREDGEIFKGEMISAFKNLEQLNSYQSAYDEASEESKTEIYDMQNALGILGVE